MRGLGNGIENGWGIERFGGVCGIGGNGNVEGKCT